MDLSYFANVAEIVGTVAVVVSLIYVAVQIRQNNRHLAHEAQRARAQAVRENFRGIADNAEILVKDQKGVGLTSVEMERIQAFWMAILFSYQTSFLQLPRQEIVGHSNFFRRYFAAQPSARATWGRNRDTFALDFVQFMEENVIGRSE